jgi:replicative DNA helicase
MSSPAGIARHNSGTGVRVGSGLPRRHRLPEAVRCESVPVVLDKLPPHDIAAEESVVAACLVDPEAIYKVAPVVKSDDFFREKNGWIFDACVTLWTRNEAINQITVAHELARRDRLEAVGGVAYLSRLVADLPTVVGVEYYAQIVARDSTYRRLISAAGQIAQYAYEGGADLDAVLNRSETLLMALRGGEALRDFVHIKTLLEKYLDDAGEDDADTDRPSTIRTGFIDLDTLLGGLKRSDLVLLAARPSVGKSALAMSFARNAAVGQRAKVAVFNLEMSGDQLAQRLVAAEAQVDSTRLRLGEHTEAEERRIMHALGILSECDIFIDDSPMVTVGELRGKVRRLQQERGLDLLIIDYLQLMQGNEKGNDNRVQEISFISRSLKNLARELNVPIVALSQLSRAVESRKPPIPMMSDLRESGSLEQDADVVMFIYREDYYTQREDWQAANPEQPGRSYPHGIAQVIVAKHRNGPVGTVDLRFHHKTAKFEDLYVREEGQ